jgi:hypothetical protein
VAGADERSHYLKEEEEKLMDPFQMRGGQIQPPQVPPKPKKPKKPDPAARRMKPLDYVSLLLGVEPGTPDQDLPPPIGYRFPEVEQAPVQNSFTPQMGAGPYNSPQQSAPLPEQYKNHIMRMRAKLGY